MTIENDLNTSLKLYGLEEKLNFFINIYDAKKLPKVLLLNGKKGVGKATLVRHFLSYIFDKENYDLNNYTIKSESSFYKLYLSNIFSDIINLSGNSFKNVKIEDIRTLKSKLLKTSINKNKRFIVLDDVELFNLNSLNALLKLIEEPTLNNHFVLIYNNTKPLLRTIYSRSICIKVILSEKQRLKIIESLINERRIEPYIDYKKLNLTPGCFLSFNQICKDNEIIFDNDFLKNIEKLLNLFKKSKNLEIINLILFLNDFYFLNQKENKAKSIEKIMDEKNFITANLNKFITFNINQKSFINAISNKLLNG